MATTWFIPTPAQTASKAARVKMYSLEVTGDDAIYGGSGGDVIYGGAGSDHILGESGADRLVGDAGNDHIEGGDGDDIILAGISEPLASSSDAVASAVVQSDGQDVYDGADGIDTFDASAITLDMVIDLTANTAVRRCHRPRYLDQH